MNITRNNYEALFMDYLDGNLMPNEVKMLRLFLDDNPDLSQELEGLNSVVLVPSSVPYSNKPELKKTDVNQFGITSTSEYLCIAEHEGDINKEELKGLEKMSSADKSIQQMRLLYRSIKLQSDNEIIFKGKSSLFRTRIFNLTPKTLSNIGAIAAGFGLILGVFSLLKSLPDIDSVQLAKDEPVVIIEKQQLNNHKNELDIEPIFEEQQNKENSIKTNEQDLSLVQEIELPKAESTHQRENIALTPISPVNFDKLDIDEKSIGISVWNLLRKEEHVLIAQEIQSSVNGSSGQSRTIGIIELAQLGAKRISNATGGNIRFNADKSSDGTIERINFETNLFALSVPVGRKK
jgi:hypothetical protein